MSQIEYEVRVLEIDVDNTINRLKELGATLIDDSLQRRYVYDFNPVDPNKWVRLRTNGKKTTITIKEIESNKIDGTKEIEIEVDDFDKANELLNELGYKPKGLQENYRIKYDLDGVEVDIDRWPRIPAYLEIEGKNEEEVLKVLDVLDIDKSYATTLDVMGIYREVYNIDLTQEPNLSFEDEYLVDNKRRI